METCGVGRVVDVKGSRAWVEIHREEACARCQSASLCHALGGRGALRVEAENAVGARLGQKVELFTSRSFGLLAAFFVYFVPAILFVGGVVIGAELLAWPAWGSGLLGFALLASSWFIAWTVERQVRDRKDFQLSIGRILPPD